MFSLSLRITFTFELGLTKFLLIVSSGVDRLFQCINNHLQAFSMNVQILTLVRKPR